jgi:DNA-binding LacI/PurR family transcriptional regulator
MTATTETWMLYTKSKPLTTVRQPIQHGGGMAVETLIEIIRHPHLQTRYLFLETELIVRSS